MVSRRVPLADRLRHIGFGGAGLISASLVVSLSAFVVHVARARRAIVAGGHDQRFFVLWSCFARSYSNPAASPSAPWRDALRISLFEEHGFGTRFTHRLRDDLAQTRPGRSASTFGFS